MSAPALAFPFFSKIYILATYANDVRHYRKEHEVKERVVAYASHILSKAETQCGTLGVSFAPVSTAFTGATIRYSSLSATATLSFVKDIFIWK